MITALRATSRTLADFLQREFEADPVLDDLFAPPGTIRVLPKHARQMDQRWALVVAVPRRTRRHDAQPSAGAH